MAEVSTKSYKNLIWIDPERVSGQPCFYGTRVPVRILFEYLEDGATLEEFLGSYPGVQADIAQAVLREAESGLVELLKAA
ncbi:MAG TPA: DUF433 domain-containing protein [Fimbriimonadaceae bacterium]|nr:DUF433 domain-containing protein [Fimbriimonadaceae bacterium]